MTGYPWIGNCQSSSERIVRGRGSAVLPGCSAKAAAWVTERSSGGAKCSPDDVDLQSMYVRMYQLFRTMQGYARARSAGAVRQGSWSPTCTGCQRGYRPVGQRCVVYRFESSVSLPVPALTRAG